MTTWNILYRGSLASCNYACGYCPFAKTSNTRAELQRDERELERFVAWVGAQADTGSAGVLAGTSKGRRIGVLLTPWGEALIHPHYRRAMIALARMPHVYRVAIQTNLSAPLGEFTAIKYGHTQSDTASRNAGFSRQESGLSQPLPHKCGVPGVAPDRAAQDTLAFCATFHPGHVPLSRFLARCRELDLAAIRYSVGVVGLREHLDAIEELRRALPATVYLWVNAFKREAGYYQPHEINRLVAVDPYFHWNLHHYASSGEPCAAGETTFTIDGKGDIRRCHFIKEIIGNIYDANFGDCLRPRNCSNAICGCHIGYIHRPALRMTELYGVGLLERIPARWPQVVADFALKSVL